MGVNAVTAQDLALEAAPALTNKLCVGERGGALTLQAPQARFPKARALTPIPGPSPIEGEGKTVRLYPSSRATRLDVSQRRPPSFCTSA